MSTRRSRGLGSGAALLLLAASTSIVEPAEAPGPTEYAVKAAFIYNFTKFVTWPAEAQGEAGAFVVTVLGRDPFGDLLDDTLRGKSVDTRRVLLRRASRVEDIDNSQIVFISSSEKNALPAILKRLEATSALTVGDIDDFAARGGVIGFRLEHEKVHLEISLAAAERSRLKISSQLLKVARLVGAGQGSGR